MFIFYYIILFIAVVRFSTISPFLARGRLQRNIANIRGLLLLSLSDRPKAMEVVDFEADAIRNSRPLSAQVRRSETYSVSRRPQSSNSANKKRMEK